MSLNDIKSAFTRRINKANVLWVTASSITLHVLWLIRLYYYEIGKIDSTSVEHFGVKLSSELGFFEVLDSANVHHFSEILSTFIFFWIPLLAAIWLFKFCVIEETHLGWKRVSLVLPVGLALLGMLLTKPIVGMIVNATHCFLFGLILVAVTRWVFKGFASE